MVRDIFSVCYNCGHFETIIRLSSKDVCGGKRIVEFNFAFGSVDVNNSETGVFTIAVSLLVSFNGHSEI